MAEGKSLKVSSTTFIDNDFQIIAKFLHQIAEKTLISNIKL